MALRNFLVVIGLATIELSLCGCAAPLVTEEGLFSRAGGTERDEKNALTSIARTPPAGDRSSAGEIRTELDPATPDASMAQVLDELEEIRAIDRHAQRRLLAELKRAPSEDWPMMVHQFRAALSYREDLPEDVVLRSRAPRKEPSNDDRGDTRSIESWRTATQRALADERAWDDDASETEEFDTALMDPARMRADDELAEVFAAAAPWPQGQNPLRSRQRDADQSVVPAVFYADDDGLDAEPAAWRDVTARPISNAEKPPQQQRTDLRWQQHLTAAIDGLSAAVGNDAQTSSGVADHTRLRLLQLAAGETDAAMTPIPGVSRTEQDFWSKQLFSLATYIDDSSTLDQEGRAALSADHLEDALSRLRELSTMRVHNLVFCEQVHDFGAYDAYRNHRFTAGRQVTLYAEVENYRSRLSEKGYHTSLATSYEVVDEQGSRIAGGEFPHVEDYCRRRRRDFHTKYTLPLPPEARTGDYRLKLTIVDNLSGKRGQNAIEFQIVDSRVAMER